MHSNDARTHVKNNRLAGKFRSRRGFTMAEMMMTVAILIILMGILFVALLTYQRNLAFKERNAIAQEIFVAAQNHLTMTKGEGYLQAADNSDDVSKIGRAEIKVGSTTGEKSGVYYFIVNNGSGFTTDESTMLDRMLPFGSIDETVRKGGSYIVRYQPKTATVLDVFYFSTSGSPDRFNHTISTTNDTEYKHIIGLIGDNHKDDRRTYTYGGSKAVLGWYGGENLEPLGFPLEVPQIKLVNGDRLIVNIHNSNFSKVTADNGVTLKLLVTGLTSNAKMSILIDSENIDPRLDKNSNFTNNDCSFVLDDVTHENWHFAEIINSEKYTYQGSIDYQEKMIPGEDIKVEAVAYSSKKLARIRFSKAEEENSLYDSISVFKTDTTGTSPNRIAYTSSLRHIENLDYQISGIAASTELESPLYFTEARQVADISWGGEVFNNDTGVFINGMAGNPTAKYYYPSSPTTVSLYDGLKHSITGLKTEFAGPAGLFGAPGINMSIKNLELINFDVNAKADTIEETISNAGALAGSLGGGTVSNVIAYNTQAYDDGTWNNGNNTVAPTVVSADGSAGGLIGTMNAGTIDYCGAALTVSGHTYAGGLIGNSTGVTLVDGCFSGGHTQDGRYRFNSGNKKPIFNVKASDGPAGGLIGASGTAEIKDSYSTCSASGSAGTNTGGFVGTASSGTDKISNCYSTGLTDHNTDNKGNVIDNAFIGSGGDAATNCYYYGAINEIVDGDSVEYKTAGDKDVKQLDATVNSYDSFVGASGLWKVLRSYKSNGDTKYVVYDDDVEGLFNHHYNLKTVIQLKNGKNANTPNDKTHFVNYHYGDWPAPELSFVNTK